MKLFFRRAGMAIIGSVFMLCFSACGVSNNADSINNNSSKDANDNSIISQSMDNSDNGLLDRSGVTESRNPYSDTDYTFPAGYDAERVGIEKSTITRNITYYSSTVGHDKTFNIILPAGYSESEKYPVVYCLHGFGSDANEWDFLMNTYDNMVADGLAAKAVFVLPNMFTSTKSYEECSGEEVRLAYDAFVNDLSNDLMPYVEGHYNVLTGRKNTAIIGLSQGGTESLIDGFLLQDRIGYIASIAPCPGVIPTEYYKGTFWNWPVLDDFTINSKDSEPYYILLSVGSLDPWDIDCTVYYDKVMTDNGIPHQYYMLDGVGHDYNMWISSFYNFMRRIF